MPAIAPEGHVVTLQTRTDFNILLGAFVTCAPPAPTCNVYIDQVTKTDETVLGLGDGTIFINCVDEDDDINFSITNGIETRETGMLGVSFYTFTNVPTGEWWVHIEEQNTECYDDWATPINILQGYFETAPFIVNTSTIPEIVASENPIVFEIQTIGTGLQPLQGIYTLTVNNVTIAENNRIVFDLVTPEYSTTIWLKEFPNRQNYALCSVLSDQFGVQKQTNTYLNIAQSIGEAIKADIVLSQYYYVSVSSNVITLKTKEKTAKYNLINGENIFIYNENGVVSATGVTFGTGTQGQDAFQGSQTDGYQVYAELYTSDTQEFGGTIDNDSFYPISELILPYLPDNKMRFNFSDVLKNYVSTPPIDFTFTGFTTIAPALRPFYVVYGERFFLIENSSTKIKRVKGSTISTPKYVLNASLPWEDNNDMTAYLGETASNMNPNFIVSATGATSFPYTSWNLTFKNVLFDVEVTGTTNIQISIWNSSNTSLVEGWRAYTAGFNGLAVGTYYARTSGYTDGIQFMYSRWFYISPYNYAQDPSQHFIPLSDVNYLTRAPNPKMVQRTNNQEFLYFILQKDYENTLDLRGDIVFYDGTEINNYKFFDITIDEFNFGGVVALNISSDKLGLPALELSGGTLRKIKTIEFAIHQNINGEYLHYSETRAFRYSIDEAERSFSCMFLNSLGGYDNFTFAGINERSVERLSGLFTTPRPYNVYGASPHSFSVNTTYNCQTTRIITCNSGWINSEMFDFLIEMLKSNYIVSSSEPNQNYLNVVGYTYKKSSLEDLFDMEVTFKFTTFENTISI